MTMSSELDKARELLKRFEQLEGDSAGLSCLTQALDLLACIINGAADEQDREVARNIACLHRAEIQKKAGELLDERKTFKPETLEYWAQVMMSVSNARLETDEKFQGVKIALLRAWLTQSLSPTELELLKQKLASKSRSHFKTHRPSVE